MGWASYMEDIIKRFEYSSNRIDRFVSKKESAAPPDYTKLQAELCLIKQDIEICLKAFQKQLEYVTDPTFNAYEKWQASLTEINRLKSAQDQLQSRLKQQETEFNRHLAETEQKYLIKIGTLEAKLKNERREAEQSIKSAKLRK